MEGMAGWLAENWFTLLSAAGIVGSLVFKAISLRSETKTRRIQNLLTLTQSHRELWSELLSHPDLARVIDPGAELSKKPITLNEAFYVNMIIQHLSSAFQAIKSGLTIKPEGVRQDIRWFFSSPIPRTIRQKIKVLQNDDFRISSSSAWRASRFLGGRPSWRWLCLAKPPFSPHSHCGTTRKRHSTLTGGCSRG
jgi:hypothetical protein